MRICVIGKFPPIQGGVSMRTYWTAHALAAQGHEVHVVTNAREARPPFRMHMREEDWARCEARTGSGSVTVHWTDPVDRSQSYIPMASPFVSKLAAVSARVHSAHPFDVVFSHYLEPYGVAGHLAAQITGAPHVVRMAGSDAGRLWHHPQLEPLYDHILRSAAAVVAAGVVAERAIARGVDPARVGVAGGYALPEHLFTPDGPVLDLERLRAEVASDPDLRERLWGDFAGRSPHFGIYGKLGDSKGSLALLEALHRLGRAGLDVGLVALAHGSPEVDRRFRERARELGLVDRIAQIPFLPHWRVPEFLRGCLAVCCLEQNFPIGHHTPITPREVLLCAACFVGSTEVIRKLPGCHRLPHGYSCVAVADVDDIEALSGQLAAIARDPGLAAVVGRRGREFARDLEGEIDFPRNLERILEAAARRRPPRPSGRGAGDGGPDAGGGRYPLTRLAAVELAGKRGSGRVRPLLPERSIDLAAARMVLAEIERELANGGAALRPLALAVRIETTIATAEDECDQAAGATPPDPLFRLQTRRWALDDDDLAGLIPRRDPQLRVVRFDFDVAGFRGARSVADLPADVLPGPSFVVVFAQADGQRPDPLLVDGLTARTLELSDGSRTAGEIARQLARGQRQGAPAHDLEWLEELFRRGLIGLRCREAAA